MTTYKLRVTMRFLMSARRRMVLIRAWEWTDKNDAIACKALMEKATQPSDTKIEFVEVVEEKAL